MQTDHKIIISDSRNLADISDCSVDLVVTSPPYPMIQMWDELFSKLSENAECFLKNEDGNAAFESMHCELDKVWGEVLRVLKDGSFACVNIGDATRTIGNRFRLYPNHARIMSCFRSLGFDCLPIILWKKPTNAPNKFMGSGMLPQGAYVTLEHEYILIFRKGNKKEFRNDAEKERRMESSFFWEERNKWFSDCWDLKGVGQGLKVSELRSRSAAYPLELAYRLMNMYSLYNDVVLDPFLGTGTTSLAAIASGRNSLGVEIEKTFLPLILEQAKSFASEATALMSGRIKNHFAFIQSHTLQKGPPKYANIHHEFPVITRQERGIRFFKITGIKEKSDLEVAAFYEPAGKISQ